MSIWSLVLTLLPIGVILCMLIIWKKPADISGIVGWLITSLIVILFFQTSLEVVFRSTIAGLIKSFSVSLIVATSLFQMAYMEKTGALKRIIIFIKTIAREDKAVQIMLINMGFGVLMMAVGATPVSLLPPILIALGYSTYSAIALPSIGYDTLCTYALLGAPIVVFVDVANGFLGSGNEITLSQVGSVFALYVPLFTILIGLSLIWLDGKWEGIKKGLLPCIITALVTGAVSFFTNSFDNLVVLTGIMCGIAVIVAMVIYMVVRGKKVIDKSALTKEELEYEQKYPLWKALTPWIILIGAILLLNIPQDMFNLLYKTLKMPIRGISANGSNIDTRFLWNAYTWILVSTLLSIPFIKPTKEQLKGTMNVWLKRAPRPFFSAAIFFAIGEVMNMSGFDMATMKPITASMVNVLGEYSAKFFQNSYGAITSVIGLFGGFITGSEASTIGMFAKYTMTTAKNLGFGLSGIIIVTVGLAFGGGLASMISPSKLQNAAASIDKLGEENQVMRTAFLFSILLIVVSSVFTVVLLNMGII